MRLSELVSASKVRPAAFAGDAELGSMVMDSRKVTPGALFVCMPGMTSDSQAFLADAASRGASAAIVYDRIGAAAAVGLGLAALQLSSDRSAFSDEIWRLCNIFFQHPTRNMKVVGITGTNGKTTTAWLIRDTLARLGIKSAYLGTLGVQFLGVERELANTTPFAVDLYSLLSEMRDAGVEALAVEVSSHALKERRIDGIEFDAGVFTNLTQDHLDFHGSMEDYANSKWRLFEDLPKQTTKRFMSVINVDDPVGREWSKRIPNNLVTYGREAASLTRSDEEVEVDRLSFELNTITEDVRVQANLGGSYNLENVLSAVAATAALGFSLQDVAQAIRYARPVPGRFEAVPNDLGIGILVDYAHTPDALEKLLDAVRPLTKSKVITVFGCGGDRDRGKRPKMARSASERSDLTVVTSDNPRSEDPGQIIQEVMTGIVPGAQTMAIEDRGEAIAYAISIAIPGDVVVIAGKGHENYQIIGRTKTPMDDRELARAGLEART